MGLRAWYLLLRGVRTVGGRDKGGSILGSMGGWGMGLKTP